MDTLLTLQILVLLAGAMIAVLMTLHAWQRRPAVGSIPFGVLMLSVTIWSLSYALALTNASLGAKLFWTKVQYVGVVLVPIAWLLFVAEYTGRERWINGRNIVALCLVPAATLLIAFSNDGHGLFWRELSVSTGAAPIYLVVDYGPWFWVHGIFSYGYLLLGSIGLVRHWRQQNQSLYQWQSLALLVGLSVPWLGNVLYLVGVSPVDLAPFAFAITGLLLMRYALRFRLFDINPVAYRRVVESMEDGVFVVDNKNRIVDANPAAVQMLPAPQEEIVGATLVAAWPQLEERLNGAPEKRFELAAATAEQPYFEVSVSPLYGWRRDLQGRLLIIRDITARKEREQLRKEMTRSMVHDLRAPISNSLFALQMLQGDLADVASDDDHMLLDMTFASTEKTLSLVNQILDIHRLESGTIPVSYFQIKVADLIAQSVRAQQSRLMAKHLTVQQVVPAGLPPVWADSQLMERVLQNLLDNAIKFSPEGGRITISACLADTAAAEESAQILVSVADEGPGIPTELQPRLFEKYVTGNADESGSGLGLPFCQTALKAHDQEIWVENAPGRGAVFTFTLAAATFE